jgi:bifunctional DNase/RNase
MIEKILLSIAILISVISLSLILTYHPEIEIPINLPFSYENYEKVKDIDITFENETAKITLFTDCYKLYAYVEDVQARSILNGKLGKRDIRPNSHDIVKDIFDELGIQVLSVRITELRNNIYFAQIDIKQKKKVISLDIRPSDGIAIALRTNAPIYIKKDLLKEKGEKIC